MGRSDEKKVLKERLKYFIEVETIETKEVKGDTEANILAIPPDTRGHLPSLLELDSKLISLLNSIRSRGSVVNYCMVKATALALVNNISGLRGFELKPTR